MLPIDLAGKERVEGESVDMGAYEFVRELSPAEAMQDLILAIDGEAVSDLRSFSGLLKKRSPGDAVEVTAERSGEKMILEAVLGAR